MSKTHVKAFFKLFLGVVIVQLLLALLFVPFWNMSVAETFTFANSIEYIQALGALGIFWCFLLVTLVIKSFVSLVTGAIATVHITKAWETAKEEARKKMEENMEKLGKHFPDDNDE